MRLTGAGSSRSTHELRTDARGHGARRGHQETGEKGNGPNTGAVRATGASGWKKRRAGRRGGSEKSWQDRRPGRESQGRESICEELWEDPLEEEAAALQSPARRSPGPRSLSGLQSRESQSRA